MYYVDFQRKLLSVVQNGTMSNSVDLIPSFSTPKTSPGLSKSAVMEYLKGGYWNNKCVLGGIMNIQGEHYHGGRVFESRRLKDFTFS